MASTNKTTNYELSQFIETDRPAWLTDYNSDMRKIDSNLKEVSDIAGGASGSISALADRMSAAEGNITTNANDIDALEARADSLEAQAQSTAGTIANIQTEQTAQNLGIEAATELGYNLARPYDSASTYAVGSYVLFQNTLYKCVTAIATGEAFDPTKWLAIKATDEIAGASTNILTNDEIFIASTPAGDNYTSVSSVTFLYRRLIIIGDLKILMIGAQLNGLSITSGSSGGHMVSIPITWVTTPPNFRGEVAIRDINTNNTISGQEGNIYATGASLRDNNTIRCLMQTNDSSATMSATDATFNMCFIYT